MEAGTISSNYSRLSICQMFLFHQNCCNYVFQDSLLSILKKEKGECDFDMEGFSFCKFCKSCFQRGIPLLSITSCLVVIRSSKNSIFYRGQAETCFPANIRLCEDVLKMSWKHFLGNTFCLPSRLQDVFKACLQDVFLKPYWRRL